MIKLCEECGERVPDKHIFCDDLCAKSNLRRKNLLKEKHIEILTLAINGYSFTDIANIFNISRERVRQKVKMYGLTASDWDIKQNRTVRRTITKCIVCDKDIICRNNNLKRFCSKACHSMFFYQNSPRDNSERMVVKSRKHPVKKYKNILVNGKVTTEHRHVMEMYLGRKLETHEHVHHIDGNGLNNDISNLQIISQHDHSQKHSKEFWSHMQKVECRLVETKNITFNELQKKLSLTNK